MISVGNRSQFAIEIGKFENGLVELSVYACNTLLNEFDRHAYLPTTLAYWPLMDSPPVCGTAIYNEVPSSTPAAKLYDRVKSSYELAQDHSLFTGLDGPDLDFESYFFQRPEDVMLVFRKQCDSDGNQRSYPLITQILDRSEFRNIMNATKELMETCQASVRIPSSKMGSSLAD